MFGALSGCTGAPSRTESMKEFRQPIAKASAERNEVLPRDTKVATKVTEVVALAPAQIQLPAVAPEVRSASAPAVGPSVTAVTEVTAVTAVTAVSEIDAKPHAVESQDLADLSPTQEEIARLAAAELGSGSKPGDDVSAEHAAAGDLFDLIVEPNSQLELSDSDLPSAQPDLSLAPPPAPAIRAASAQAGK